MKTISKKKLDELIAQERQYWESYGTTDYKAGRKHGSGNRRIYVLYH